MQARTAYLAVAAILLLAAFYTYSPTSLSGTNTGRSLGVWTQVVDWPQGYANTGSNYAQAIFKGPAGFTNIEAMINENFNNEITVVGQAATWADQNGGQIEVMCVLDPTNLGFGIPQWEAMVQSLDSHPSIVSFGINAERSPGLTAASIATLQSFVLSQGKQFINYYISGAALQTGSITEIRHTNFPDYGDVIVKLSSAPYVGESFGYFAPYTETDWNQNVVNSIMQTMGSTPVQYSQFTNFAYGDPTQASFQNMIAASPYRNLFNGQAQIVSTSTSASTSTSTSTSVSTSTSTTVISSTTSTITSLSTFTSTSTSTTPPPTGGFNIVPVILVLGAGALGYLALRRKR